MTRSEVIEALLFYNGRATKEQIEQYLISTYNQSSYTQHVLQRMRNWKEVTTEKGPKQLGGRPFIYILEEKLKNELQKG